MNTEYTYRIDQNAKGEFNKYVERKIDSGLQK